jgi:chorismate--pyruvate lyase
VSFTGCFPVGLPVNWKEACEVTFTDAYLKNWLLDTGSLTERVQSLCHHFSLTLLGQQALEPADSELALLNATPQTPFQIREVLLCADGVPWVFARSIIPQTLVDDELANLGGQPLGKRLFNDVRFTRSAFQLTTLAASTLGYTQKQRLWGRRSMFTLEQDKMIVAEVFLPHAPVYDARYQDEI